MSIRWDALLVRETARELERELSGVELRAFRLDGAERDLFLLFRDRTLIWRLHPSRGQLLVRDATPPGPNDLRHAARVRRVVAPPDERLIRIELLPKRSGPPRDLIVELLGNQWNAIVVEAASRTVRHVLWSRDTGRGHRVGAIYAPPDKQPRAGVDGKLGIDDWLALVKEGDQPVRPRTLVRNVAWTSPLNAPALLGRDLDGLTERERLVRGHERWRDWVRGNAPEGPVLLDADGGQPYPFPVPGIPARPVSTLLDGFEAAGLDGSGDSDAAPSLVDPDLIRRLEHAAERARRRAGQLARELDGLGDEDTLRATGDLILARYGDVARGKAEAVLVDFEGAEVRVELDPELEPHQNAARYYDRATRIERARERLPGLIEKAGRDAEALEDVLRRARTEETTPEELLAAIPSSSGPPSGGDEEQVTVPYRTFTSSGGLEIRVGRGARHNDDLTFHHSSPGDVWLHARHTAGAHVILRWNGPGNPPSRDLAEAATLAALHSKARTSGSVPVDWTFRKYVRKPRGAARGAVVPDRVSTLFVHPDPAVERALAPQ
ncbi:MAG: NFACT RNA binding domain-containing protein [Gemmatimonadota bacterium]